MHCFYRPLLLLAAWGLVAAGCSFFTNPEEATSLGELQINIRFANLLQPDSEAATIAKTGARASPQAIDRVVVIVLARSASQTPDTRLLERELIRREFRLDNNRQLQAVIQVPLENAGKNCFRVVVQALQDVALLYSGQDIPCFDEKNKRLVANIVLEPEAFDLNILNNDLLNGSRTFVLSGTLKDTTTLTEVEITAANVSVKFPVRGFTLFNNPVMLFGDTTLVRVIAWRQKESRGEATRRVIYTGRKSDMLVAMTWDQPVNLDLAINTPLQQIITVNNPTDSVDVLGKVVLSDADGFGPEVYEWRNSLQLQGLFSVRVRRTQLTAPVTGRVYVFLREGQKGLQRQLPAATFQLNPQDREIEVTTIQWPPL